MPRAVAGVVNFQPTLVFWSGKETVKALDQTQSMEGLIRLLHVFWVQAKPSSRSQQQGPFQQGEESSTESPAQRAQHRDSTRRRGRGVAEEASFKPLFAVPRPSLPKVGLFILWLARGTYHPRL